MFEALSAARMAVGSALARYAPRSEILEAWAGALLILGFGLLGSALPHLH